MSGEESPHPGLLAGSHRWVVPCAPDAAFGAVHGVAEELALPALALLVAGRGAGLHHFLICWRRAEGQSPGPGLRPAPRPRPGSVKGSAHAPTSRPHPCRLGVGGGAVGWGREPTAQIHPKSTRPLVSPGRPEQPYSAWTENGLSQHRWRVLPFLLRRAGSWGCTHISRLRGSFHRANSLPPRERHSASRSLLRV